MLDEVKIFEAFAGVGAQRMALRNLDIPHKVVGIAEIDKHAIRSYELIHGVTPNYGDITKIEPDKLPDMDLFTYSFPCQDLSLAGKLEGLGKGTRSGLLYECEKIIEAKRPKYLLLENVKNLVGRKFKPEFDKWLEYLEGLGYSNYWQVLNAKDYGVPQNRERVYVVSILHDKRGYKFPEPQELKLRLKDILEPEVEERYYMDKPYELLNKPAGDSAGLRQVARLGIKGNDCIRRVYDIEGAGPTVTTCEGGHREPKVLYRDRVRKLTPLECWRLMGFNDKDYYKAEVFNSNTQLYKQAGNSIVVPVLEGIFKNLLK